MDHRLIIRTPSGTLHGRSKNLAEGGMAATVAGEISIGEPVELEIQVPNSSTPLVLEAEVRFRQGFQYGFRFLPFSQQKLAAVRKILSTLDPMNDE